MPRPRGEARLAKQEREGAASERTRYESDQVWWLSVLMPETRDGEDGEID